MALVQLEHVKKEFGDKSQPVLALDDVSLTIEAGDIYGIIGYSGAGKSTLIRLLNGLETPTQGEVRVQNQIPATLSSQELSAFRKKIGMIFQHFHLLWSRTVQENVELPLELAGVPKKQRRERSQELLRLVGLSGREAAYPSQLSGGQKQRVGIARALANAPQILLCDEATSALDPQTTDEVLDLLLKINKELQLTIILITHEMHVIRKICNKVAVMEQGKIVEQGDVLDVFLQPKQAITKRFVQQEMDQQDDTEALIQQFIAENPQAFIVNLHFKKDTASEPIISQAIQQFQVVINVLQGKIQHTEQGALGSLIVMLTGSKQNMAQAMAFFDAQGVGTEVMHRG